jgi:hypothetical protein
MSNPTIAELAALRETALVFLARAICRGHMAPDVSKQLKAHLCELEPDHTDVPAIEHAMNTLCEQNIRARVRE